MKLELYEARGNLDKINSSILLNNKLKLTAVSPNSEVYVDKLRNGQNIHTWANVTDNIVMQPNVAFVVVRSNKRQLLLISHNKDIVGDEGRYMLVWSDIAMAIDSISELTNGRDMILTSNNINVQHKMWKTVDEYVNNTKGRKNWDIIVVKVDETLPKTRENRKNAKMNREIKPSEGRGEYASYISKLQVDLQTRLKKYSESKLTNIQDENQFRDFINSSAETLFPKKIKIANTIYNYSRTEHEVAHRGNNPEVVIYSVYAMDNYNTDLSQLKYLVYKILISSMKKINIENVYFSASEYSMSKTYDFKDGVDKLLQNKNQ